MAENKAQTPLQPVSTEEKLDKSDDSDDSNDKRELYEELTLAIQNRTPSQAFFIDVAKHSGNSLKVRVK